MTQQLLTPQQVAEQLLVPVETLRQWRYVRSGPRKGGTTTKISNAGDDNADVSSPSLREGVPQSDETSMADLTPTSARPPAGKRSCGTVGDRGSSSTQRQGPLHCVVEDPPVMTSSAATVLARIVRALGARQEREAA